MFHKRLSQFLLLGISLALGLSINAFAQEGTHQAAIVISLEDGQVLTRCIPFDEEQISGFELLSRTDLDLAVEVVGMGTTVCQIQGSGCPAKDCFCQCKGGGPCLYWSYWHLDHGTWRYSQAGAGSYRVGHGAVEGWVWGAGAPNEAPEPPQTSFAEICPADLPVKAGGELNMAATPQFPRAATAAGVAESETTTLPRATISPGSGSATDAGQDPGSLAAYGLFGLVIMGIALLFFGAFRRQKGGQ